jgi:hypothetical protein
VLSYDRIRRDELAQGAHQLLSRFQAHELAEAALIQAFFDAS